MGSQRGSGTVTPAQRETAVKAFKDYKPPKLDLKALSISTLVKKVKDANQKQP